MNGTDSGMVNYVVLDFTLQLLATLIGAFVGFGLAIFWEWKAKHNELKETKIRILNSISSELAQIKDSLKPSLLRWEPKTKEFLGNYSTNSFVTFDTAMYSGNLVHFSHTLQLELAMFNDIIKQEQFFMKEMLTFHKYHFLNDSELHAHANVLIKDILDMHEEIEDGVKKLEDLIKKERQELD